MGTVVEVTHVQLGASFALKFLHHDAAANPGLTERFFREARAAGALKSEHVCRVFDVGVFDGKPYLVMERLEGTDLARVLRRRGRLAVPEACDVVIQACAGIAEAHAAQIVHRDLKPGNLFLTERADGTPLVKVLDFGIAKSTQEGDQELTGTHTILGSPSYMSLEQLRSSKLVDRRSDIWSLGVILFELVAGRRPFSGDGIADLALKIAMEPTPRLPDGPAVLDDVIARCLARDPAQRYPEAAALALALAPLASDRGRALAAGIARTTRQPTAPAVPPSSPHAVQLISAPAWGAAEVSPTVPPTMPPTGVSPAVPPLGAPPTVTTLSSGAMETVPRPDRGSGLARTRRIGMIAAIVGVAMIGIAIIGGVSGGGGGNGDDAKAGSAEPRKPLGMSTEDAAAAAAELPRPPPPAVPSDAETFTPTIPDRPSTPAGAAAAAAAEPTLEPEVAPAPPTTTPPPAAAPPPAKKPPPRTPPRRPAPPTTDDLSKSRI
jgi:serine/threonine-protein kinase